VKKWKTKKENTATEDPLVLSRKIRHWRKELTTSKNWRAEVPLWPLTPYEFAVLYNKTTTEYEQKTKRKVRQPSRIAIVLYSNKDKQRSMGVKKA